MPVTSCIGPVLFLKKRGGLMVLKVFEKSKNMILAELAVKLSV